MPPRARGGASKFTGQSRILAPGSLLKNIEGRRENGIDVVGSKASPAMASKEPERLDAPPLSSDDEDDAYKRSSDHSDSDNERQKSADIIRTKFGTKAGASMADSAKDNRNKASSTLKTVDKKKDPGSEPSHHTVGSKRPAAEMTQSPESHLTDSYGFTGTTKRARKSGSLSRTASYSKLQKLERKPSQRSSTTKVHAPTTSPSPQKSEDPKKVFKKASVSPSVPSSPVKPEFKSRHGSEGSPEKPRRKFIKPDDDTPVPSLGPAQPRGPTRGAGKSRDAREGKRKSLEKAPREEPVSKFKLPDMEGLEDIGDSKPVMSTQALGLVEDPEMAGLNSDSSLSDLDDDEDLRRPKEKDGAVCPMCHEPVDPELLQQHLVGGRMNVKRQTAFCRLHKRKEAQDVQRSKGYPEVDWTTVEPRFEKHAAALSDILEGRCDSHYAARLAEQVDAGESRTILKTRGAPLIPGYYGPRGLRVMAEFITKRFSGTIRRRAVADRLVAARGHAAYVQAVLVPELAVRLIMEDLSLDEERARGVMVESGGLGELVQEETRDVVRWSDDEDQELAQQRDESDEDEE